MEICIRHSLAFALAVVAAIGLWHLTQLAFWTSFENSNAPNWTAFESYFRLGAFIGPPVIVGFVFRRRSAMAGALVGLIVSTYVTWPELVGLFAAEHRLTMVYFLELASIGLTYILLTALAAALVAWLRFKWFPRSPFGAVKFCNAGQCMRTTRRREAHST